MTTDNSRVGHTPGPWRIAEPGVVEMAPEGARLSFWAGLGFSGQLPNPTGQEPGAERDANARLIAAAPELLEALEALRLFHASGGHEGDADVALRLADWAIAKARGQS